MNGLINGWLMLKVSQIQIYRYNVSHFLIPQQNRPEKL